MLDQIKQKVQTIANNSNRKIIIGLYGNLISKHNEFCGCNYCIILEQYVAAKKYLTKHNRISEYQDDNIPIDYASNYFLDRYNIRKKIKQLKFQKDILKTI